MTAIDESASVPRTSPEVALARIPPASSTEVGELLVRAVVVGLGAASLAAAVVTNALARSLGVEATAREGSRDELPVLTPPRIAGAFFGLGVEVGRWSTREASQVARRLRPLLSFVGQLPPVRLAGNRFEDLVPRLDASWKDGRAQREETASAFVDALVAEIVDAALDHVDLTSLALERIDVNRLLDAMDVNSIVDRVDVDALAERVDLDALVQRLELVRIAQQVIDELDIGEIIRDSTGSMATETVEGIRVQGMNADRFVSRLVDRAFGRRGNDDARSLGRNGDSERAR
jgi:hypothetical protein